MNLNETNFLISICIALLCFIFVFLISTYSKLKVRQENLEEIINSRLKALDKALQNVDGISWKVDTIYDSAFKNQKLPNDHFMNLDLE